MFYLWNPAELIDVPHEGWLDHDGVHANVKVLPMLKYSQQLYSNLQKDHQELLEDHSELQRKHAMLESAHSELTSAHSELWATAKQLMMDTKDPEHKRPRQPTTPTKAPPVLKHSDNNWGGSSSSSASGLLPPPPPGEYHRGQPGQGRNRPRTRAGVRVQAQRIVDLFVQGQYKEIVKTVPEGTRFHDP